jgi:hypothetical protein
VGNQVVEKQNMMSHMMTTHVLLFYQSKENFGVGKIANLWMTLGL